MKHAEKHVVYTQLGNKEESYKHRTLAKGLDKATKATKIHKKVAITQGKIRYKNDTLPQEKVHKMRALRKVKK